MHRPPEYSPWQNMLNRCRNPDTPGYDRYGGRGITVCSQWRTFAAFLADMGSRPSPEHSIDRIDNDGNYEPGNCRWATPEQQQRNRANNRLLGHGGKVLCIADWAELRGLTRGIIMSRLLLGWSIGDTLDTPPRWKLKPHQVAEIRARLSGRNGSALAREFGVSNATISMIRNGKIWR